MIKRDKYLQQLIKARNNGFPKVITGIRRCGKSYLLEEIFRSYLLSDGVYEKNGLGRFSFYLIHLYSHGESTAIKVKVRIGQLWCPGLAVRRRCRAEIARALTVKKKQKKRTNHALNWSIDSFRCWIKYL